MAYFDETDHNYSLRVLHDNADIMQVMSSKVHEQIFLWRHTDQRFAVEGNLVIV